MKRFICLLLCSLSAIGALAQRENIPASVQKDGFYLQKSVFASMDGDPAAEQVFLFGRDNGHWPEFDLFKSYIAVVDSRTQPCSSLTVPTIP